MKAFHPAKLPFPLLHVDTTWKFREMIAFRDETARRLGLDLIVHINEGRGQGAGISPIASGSSIHTQVMKTEALQAGARARYGFDAAIGGARRDEEKSRAKERGSRSARRRTRGTRRTSAPNSGVSTIPACTRENRSASSRSRTGPSSTSGNNPRGAHPRRAALFRQAAPGGRARRARSSWSTTTGCRSSPARRPTCAGCVSARSAAIR